MAAIARQGDFVSVSFPNETAGKPLGYIVQILQGSAPILQVVRGGLLDSLLDDNDDDGVWYILAFLFQSESTGKPVWTHIPCTSESLHDLAFHANHQRPFSAVLARKVFFATNSYAVRKTSSHKFVRDSSGLLFLVDDQGSIGDRVVQVDNTLVNASYQNDIVDGQMLVCVRKSSKYRISAPPPPSPSFSQEEPSEETPGIFQRVDDWVSSVLTEVFG